MNTLEELIETWRDVTTSDGMPEDWVDALHAAADELEERLEDNSTWMPMNDKPEPGDGDEAGQVIVLSRSHLGAKTVSTQPIAGYPWLSEDFRRIGWTPVVL